MQLLEEERVPLGALHQERSEPPQGRRRRQRSSRRPRASASGSGSSQIVSALRRRPQAGWRSSSSGRAVQTKRSSPETSSSARSSRSSSGSCAQCRSSTSTTAGWRRQARPGTPTQPACSASRAASGWSSASGAWPRTRPRISWRPSRLARRSRRHPSRAARAALGPGRRPAGRWCPGRQARQRPVRRSGLRGRRRRARPRARGRAASCRPPRCLRPSPGGAARRRRHGGRSRAARRAAARVRRTRLGRPRSGGSPGRSARSSDRPGKTGGRPRRRDRRRWAELNARGGRAEAARSPTRMFRGAACCRRAASTTGLRPRRPAARRRWPASTPTRSCRAPPTSSQPRAQRERSAQGAGVVLVRDRRAEDDRPGVAGAARCDRRGLDLGRGASW